jgi:hypothetical protein
MDENSEPDENSEQPKKKQRAAVTGKAKGKRARKQK